MSEDLAGSEFVCRKRILNDPGHCIFNKSHRIELGEATIFCRNQVVCLLCAIALVKAANNGKQSNGYNLTKCEIEVLEFLVEGCRNKDIGVKLFISDQTVKSHISHIFKKLSVTNRTEAVAKALQEGIII